MRLTTDGDEKTRIKYGAASWVYGEELEQRTAIWWSPDSKRVAYYGFDESQLFGHRGYQLPLRRDDQPIVQGEKNLEADVRRRSHLDVNVGRAALHRLPEYLI